MARAQAQYLRIFDEAGVTYQRWQSYYVEKTVAFDGAFWNYVPFIADGLVAGISGDESSINVTAPATSVVMAAFLSALDAARLVQLSIYQFDSLLGNNTPQAAQQLIGSFTGQIVGGSGGLTSITLTLGDALSPVGAQIPPRRFTTAIIGKGCIL
jgi:hypothetical protein